MRPSPAEQHDRVQALLSGPASSVDAASAGDVWWVLALSWYNRWKAHVDFANGGANATGQQQAPPGPIDNSTVRAPGRGAKTQRLRPGVSEGADYALLPDAVYKLLVDWYGIEPAQAPGFRRHVTAVGENSVEVSVPVFDLLTASAKHIGGNPAEAFEVVLSKYQRIEALVPSVLAQLIENGNVTIDDAPDLENVRLWFSLGKGACVRACVHAASLVVFCRSPLARSARALTSRLRPTVPRVLVGLRLRGDTHIKC